MSFLFDFQSVGQIQKNLCRAHAPSCAQHQPRRQRIHWIAFLSSSRRWIKEASRAASRLRIRSMSASMLSITCCAFIEFLPDAPRRERHCIAAGGLWLTNGPRRVNRKVLLRLCALRSSLHGRGACGVSRRVSQHWLRPVASAPIPSSDRRTGTTGGQRSAFRSRKRKSPARQNRAGL